MKPKETRLRPPSFSSKKRVSNTTVAAQAHKYPGKIVHEDFDSTHYTAAYFNQTIIPGVGNRKDGISPAPMWLH